MGIDVDPEVMVGIDFNSFLEAKSYIEENFPSAQELSMEDKCVDDLYELADCVGLEWQEISGYSDYGGVLGKHIGPKDLRYKSKGVDSIWEQLYSIFPVKDRDKIDVHIWARYW